MSPGWTIALLPPSFSPAMTRARSPPASVQWASGSQAAGCSSDGGPFSDSRPAGWLQRGLGDVAQPPSLPALPFGTLTSLAVFKVSEQRRSRDAVVGALSLPPGPLPVLGSDPTAAAGEVPPAHSRCPPPPWRTTPPPAPARSGGAIREQALGVRGLQPAPLPGGDLVGVW